MNYLIELNLENGNTITLNCGSKESYDEISKMLEETLPNKGWEERIE